MYKAFESVNRRLVTESDASEIMWLTRFAEYIIGRINLSVDAEAYEWNVQVESLKAYEEELLRDYDSGY